MTIKEASIWATKYLEKNVTASNISYLIQYGRIPRNGGNGTAIVNRYDLEEYYKTHHETKADRWKKQLGDDLNWNLSFSEYKESETTKHVHRLHPYKGKFIPQLVEYFLDKHTDNFKKQSFFNQGDIILDPFCGSGTTLVQANELGINALGVDVSAFNSFISNIKIENHDTDNLRNTSLAITHKLKEFQKEKNNVIFEQKLLDELKVFNNKFFPSPEFKYKVRHNEINEKQYGSHNLVLSIVCNYLKHQRYLSYKIFGLLNLVLYTVVRFQIYLFSQNQTDHKRKHVVHDSLLIQRMADLKKYLKFYCSQQYLKTLEFYFLILQ